MQKRAALLLGLLSIGCAAPDGGTGGSGGSGAGPTISDAVGTFEVRLVPAAPDNVAYTAVSGRVADAPTPPNLLMRIVERAGDCQLRKPHAPVCRTPCDGTSVCADDDRCQRSPIEQNVGTIRVKGLGAAEFTMQLIVGTYQLPGDVMLPYPPAAEGTAIVMQTSGGVYEPFTLEGRAIAPLVLAGSGPLPLTPGMPLRLEWTRPGDASLARVAVRIEVSHHGGGLKGDIVCETADSGALAVPASLLDHLVALGTAGFPTVYVTRVASNSVAIRPGRVALEISSSAERNLQIPNLTSCTKNEDCPSGKTCQGDDTCR
jgi:hypothetical protein